MSKNMPTYQDLEQEIRELKKRSEKQGEEIEQLRRAEEKYHSLFDHANDSMFIIDPETRKFLDCNLKAASRLGYTREELLKMTLDDIYTKMAAERNENIIKELKKNGSVVFEHNHKAKDGTLIPVEISSRVILYGNKTVFQSIVRDLTERKQAEDASERYKVLFNGIQDAVFVHRVIPGKGPGNFLDVNEAACKRLGYTKKEFLQLSPKDINPPESNQNIPKMMKTLMKEKHVLFETEHLGKDGSTVPSEIHAHLFNMEGGHIIISIARDITDRKRWERKLRNAYDQLDIRVRQRTAELEKTNVELNREIKERKEAEEALRQSEERFRAIADYTYDWENWVAPDGTLIWVNPAVERITGFSVEEYMDSLDRMRLVIHEDDYDKVNAMFLDGLKDKKSGNDIPFRIRRKDGTACWGSVSFQPIYSANGKYLGIRSSIRDITEKKKAEMERQKLMDQLREVQKLEAIGTLAGGIAHDFNNILSAILGYTELAQNTMDQTHGTQPMLKEVLKAGNRARDLIKQILAFSRQGEKEQKPFQVQLVVREAMNLIRATIPKNIRIEEKIERRCGTIFGDPTQFHQVVMNLCTNAYHAMRPGGGTMRVVSRCTDILPEDTNKNFQAAPGNYVLLEVSDTGQGMSRTVMDRIFDPYFTTKEQGEGTGLGLSVVHGIVKNHQGYIWVYSEPGHGTTFRVLIPREDAGEDDTGVEAVEIPRGSGQHILMVDDEEPLIDLGTRMLEDLGYRVAAFTSSAEALRFFQESREDIDLVLTDMSMPHLTGAQLARKILEIKPDIPLILCTGFSEIISEKKAKAHGFREFIMKPMLKSELANAIHRLLS